jgi:hypothetical protein
MPAIPTATRCSCGEPVNVRHNTVEWVAWCEDCFDPVEDAPASALVRGFGDSPEAALWAWQELHDEIHEVELAPASDVIGNLARDVSIEADRQRGWKQKRDWRPDLKGCGNYEVGCIFYGPPPPTVQVIDLFEALKKSLEEAQSKS